MAEQPEYGYGVPEHEFETAPAQSDAPSAEPFSEWYSRTNSIPISDIGVFSHKHIVEAAEAYAALRTARADEQLQNAVAHSAALMTDKENMSAKVAQLEKDNDGLSAAIEYQKEETRKLMRELESLTPSGSEFVNDPEACVAYVKKARRSLHEIAKKAIIEKNELAAALSEARERAQKLEDALEGMFDSYDIITSLASDNPIMRGMIAGAFLGVEKDRALLAGASGAAGKGGAE